ncbi:MAG: DUF4332 domain-containing protein [Hyphomonadaceae bacterium]|nr:DUF4332 domain-containing protein [Hyphomonadaceae bacterium]
MTYPIDEIDGLSERLSASLHRAGVKTTRDLLDRGAKAESRPALARILGVAEAELERAVQMADLLRIKGVARRFAPLVHAAGARSVSAVAAQQAGRLYTAIVAAKSRVAGASRLPTQEDVARWIEDAAILQPIVT